MCVCAFARATNKLQEVNKGQTGDVFSDKYSKQFLLLTVNWRKTRNVCYTVSALPLSSNC